MSTILFPVTNLNSPSAAVSLYITEVMMIHDCVCLILERFGFRFFVEIRHCFVYARVVLIIVTVSEAATVAVIIIITIIILLLLFIVVVVPVAVAVVLSVVADAPALAACLYGVLCIRRVRTAASLSGTCSAPSSTTSPTRATSTTGCQWPLQVGLGEHSF